MNRFLLIFCISLLIPASPICAGMVFAAGPSASFSVAHSLITSSSSPGNEYVAGVSVVVTAPIAGDLSAVGGTIISAAPVAGDDLLLAGSIRSQAPVAGDFRAVGGNITVEKPVSGDIVLFGVSVSDAGRAGGTVFIGALDTTMTNGASGPVTIYGNNISLAGDFAGNVRIVASGRLTLSPDTKIHGALSYEAPETAIIPASAIIVGGTTYKNLSYLPNSGTSQMLAFMSVWFFLVMRILGALILAGLLTGLFPRFTETVTERVYIARLRSTLLTLFLGFAILVATPILLIVVALTFVGIGISILLLILYTLLVFLALLYAGILLGSVLARRFAHRANVLWHDGVLGMLAFSLIALIPYVGLFIVLLFTMFAAGALTTIFFDFAFPRGGQTPELL